MATNTGHKWSSWTAVTKAGPADITSESLAASGGAVQSLAIVSDQKTAVEISVKVVFSNHAIAAGTGLKIAVLRDTDGGTNPETAAVAWTIQIDGVQAGTIYRSFTIDPGMTGPNLVLLFTNTNTTASNTATITVKQRSADVPMAVA